jgi:uncharacterized protein (DUF1697 family)
MRLGGYVALLRGINVGGKHKLAMRDLKKIFEQAGCANVATHIQSGNVIFEASRTIAAAVPGAVQWAIEKHAGFATPVIVRSAGQMRAIIDHNPYAKDSDANRLHVMFLSNEPAATAVASLGRLRGHPDDFTVSGSNIYLRLLNGVAGTKLTNAWFDRELETISTGRNWRTTTRLEQLVRER